MADKPGNRRFRSVDCDAGLRSAIPRIEIYTSKSQDLPQTTSNTRRHQQLPPQTMVLDRVRQILTHISPFTDTSSISPYPGLSYHIGATNKPLKHVTLGELLREQVSLNGDCEALVSAWQGIRWTYRELNEKSDELARSFWGLGMRKGDRMAIMAGNCGEYVLVCMGWRVSLMTRHSLQLLRLVRSWLLLIPLIKRRSLNLRYGLLVHSSLTNTDDQAQKYLLPPQI